MWMCGVFGILNAQTVDHSLTIHKVDEKELFDRLIDFSLHHDYFVHTVNSLDKFMQISYTQEKPKKIFSAETDKVITYNIFVRSLGEKVWSIRVQARVSELIWNGEVHKSSYYYKDLGVSQDVKIYKQLMAALTAYFD